MTGKIKLPHASGNSMSIAAPATNPASDLTLQLPNTVGTGKINHGNVLEQFFTPCDGSTITVPSGTYTVGDVDAAVDQTTSYVDVPGSSITYTPPAGATQVIYEYRCHWSPGDTIPLFQMKLFLAGTEVSEARAVQYSGERDQEVYFKWAFNIGGSAVDATGRVASWSSGKEIKLQGREYSVSNEVSLFKIYFWDGTAGAAVFTRPSVGITAIGTPT